MDKIINLFKTFGDTEYYGECVSKTVHMLQAATAAQNKGEHDFLVLACLLHDIGHFLEKDNMDGLGVMEHGKVGGAYLRSLGMNERVCTLVENHVNAKKYLVSKYDDYYNKLSEPSKQTLEFQGGKMTKSEMEQLEKHPDFEYILKVRHYDDVGKDETVSVPTLESYYWLINKYLNTSTSMENPTPKTLEYYRTQLNQKGFLLLKNYWNPEETQQIIDFKSQLEFLSEEKGKWMIYYEKKDNIKFKSRIENFTYFPENRNIKQFLDYKVNTLLNGILNDKMVLFKDKMNWKLANGDGFLSHQDHSAWNDFDITRFYSVALFGNPTTVANGCLEIARNRNNEGLLTPNGILTEIQDQFDWEYVETTPSDLLIFDSFIPHKSERNTTSNPRTIFYFTYNRESEGNHYSHYVEKKREYFPPPNERSNSDDITLDNKYNLGNPLK